MEEGYEGYIIIDKKDEPIGIVLESNKKDITTIGFIEVFIDKETARKNIPSKYKDSYKIVGVKVLINSNNRYKLICQDCKIELEATDDDIEDNRKTALCPYCSKKMEKENSLEDD